MKGPITVLHQHIILPTPVVARNEARMLALRNPPKYKFSRAKWYVAEYDNKHHFEVLAWCSQQFGPYPARPDAWSRWVNMYSEKIHFRDEKDYQWFLLRWGA